MTQDEGPSAETAVGSEIDSSSLSNIDGGRNKVVDNGEVLVESSVDKKQPFASPPKFKEPKNLFSDADCELFDSD